MGGQNGTVKDKIEDKNRCATEAKAQMKILGIHFNANASFDKHLRRLKSKMGLNLRKLPHLTAK